MDRLPIERWPRAWQRLLRSGQAESDEWQRCVVENTNLQAEMSEIRGWLGLPAERVSEATKQAVWQEVTALTAKYQLPARWHLMLCVALEEGARGIPVDMNLPESRSYHLPDGGERHELIITPDTDITNPLVLDRIVQWQREHVEPCPRPQPMPGDSRKHDWRPILEWRKRHPTFTHEDIAKLIRQRPDRVRKKLAELESRSDD